MTGRFRRFIDTLSEVEVSSRACNQYSRTTGDLKANAIRRRNLLLYLSQLQKSGSRMMLVGEAPSYRGGRLTGIAFVSETVMLGGIATRAGQLLGAQQGYRKATDGPRLSTEASATMVWGTIRTINPTPLLWNAFPFHPFHPGDPDSNRAPTPAELEIGHYFLRRLIALFAFETIVAVGNHASNSLTSMEIAHARVRHPSNGGKNLFVAGMAQLSQ